MPKAKRPRGSSGAEGNVSLAEQIIQGQGVKPITRVKSRGKAARRGGEEEGGDEYVDEKLSRRILEQARIQQEELEAEHGAGREESRKKKTTLLGEYGARNGLGQETRGRESSSAPAS